MHKIGLPHRDTADAKAVFLPKIRTEVIGGIPIASISRARTAQLMVDVALAIRQISAPALVFTSANGEVIAKNNRHSSALNSAHLISADGQPLVFASRFLGAGGIMDRSATTDLFHDVARIAEESGLRFFLLGANERENAAAVRNVKRLYPRLRIVGQRCGYFGSLADEAEAVEHIDATHPDIVWVGLGYPFELEFCWRWRASLTNVGIMKTCGGLFNFLSGTRSRAPEWMQSAGLEWSYRLALEPRRLFKRYFITNIKATWILATRTHLGQT
jgi:exopolysaccharide biosynthesis WecB/TagA/CpsF family protein